MRGASEELRVGAAGVLGVGGADLGGRCFDPLGDAGCWRDCGVALDGGSSPVGIVDVRRRDGDGVSTEGEAAARTGVAPREDDSAFETLLGRTGKSASGSGVITSAVTCGSFSSSDRSVQPALLAFKPATVCLMCAAYRSSTNARTELFIKLGPPTLGERGERISAAATAPLPALRGGVT